MRTSIRVGALVAAVGAVVAGVALGSSPGRHRTISDPGPITTLPHPPAAAMKLVAYSDCPAMLAQLREHAAEHSDQLGSGGVMYDGAEGSAKLPAAAPGAASSAGSALQPAAPQHSTTNVHEAGADEPDVVKTDGRRIVTMSRGVLRVVDTATRRVTGSVSVLPPGQDWLPPTNLLLSGDRALVVTPAGYGNVVDDSPVPYPGLPQAFTRFVLVDLAGTPTVLGSLTVSGNYVDARMVGSTARLVARSQPQLKYPLVPQRMTPDRPSVPIQDQVRNAIRKAPLSAWLPTYRITEGGHTRSQAVDCGQVSHPLDYTGTSMLTIYSVDLTRHLGDIKPISLAADGDTVYGTTSSLYVASNPRWFYAVPVAMPSSPIGGPTRAVPMPKQPPEQTEIHRFDITAAGPPRYVGSGDVPGRLLNQYALSEYDGYLRVATTSGAPGVPIADGGSGTSDSQSAVYVLNAGTMARVGSVGGLGKGQRIYSVRFIGAMGYVVTFRQVDPLYTLDLSDPAHPRVAGQLELTGYSAYLAPAGDGRLIGVGQEADAQGHVLGLQVALFDVHDPAHPKRLAQVVKQNVHANAEWDPHALLYWPPTGMLVLPADGWSGNGYFVNALVLHVTDSAITARGWIEQPPDDQQSGIQRAMIIGDELWTLSGNGLKVSDAATLQTRSWITL